MRKLFLTKTNRPALNVFYNIHSFPSQSILILFFIFSLLFENRPFLKPLLWNNVHSFQKRPFWASLKEVYTLSKKRPYKASSMKCGIHFLRLLGPKCRPSRNGLNTLDFSVNLECSTSQYHLPPLSPSKVKFSLNSTLMSFCFLWFPPHEVGKGLWLVTNCKNALEVCQKVSTILR